MYPREAEVLLGRIVGNAVAMQSNLEYLADVCHHKTAEEAHQGLERAINLARAIWFDARRAAELARDDTAALREVYEESIVVVDVVRANGTLGDPLDPIANIQEAIRGLFPDHELISE